MGFRSTRLNYSPRNICDFSTGLMTSKDFDRGSGSTTQLDYLTLLSVVPGQVPYAVSHLRLWFLFGKSNFIKLVVRALGVELTLALRETALYVLEFVRLI